MKPLSQPKPSNPIQHFASLVSPDRQSRTQLRVDADAILRDLAFVLKMTQQVRDEIETEKESEAFAMA
jgi:hypothetical protein